MDYVTIDFETANNNLTSACSVGIVGASNSKIVFEKYYLINPLEPFLPYNIAIHNITYDDVKDAPTFDQIWDEIFPILDGNIVFAHASGFDISVLKSLLDKYGLKYPNIKIGCTLRVSRIAFKGVLSSFKLSNISNYLEVSHNHHNAISDASICYYLLERVKRMYQVYDVIDLFEELGLVFGILNKNEYRDCYQRLKKAKTKTKSNRLEGRIIAYTGKPETMTKTELKKFISENGGLYSREISRIINTFIILTNPTKAHLEALKRLESIKNIDVLSEKEFLELTNGK